MGSTVKSLTEQDNAIDAAYPVEGEAASVIDTGDRHYLGGTLVPAIARKINDGNVVAQRLFKEGKFPYTEKIGRDVYEAEKARL